MTNIKLGTASGLAQDVFLSEQSSNRSILAIGASGYGKTYAIQKIEENIAASGGCVVVLNFNGTHDNLQEPERVFRIDCYRDGIPFPVLCQFPRPDGGFEDVDDAADAILDIFANTSRLQVRQKAVLRQAIMSSMVHGMRKQDCSFQHIAYELQKNEGEVAQSVRDRFSPVFRKVTVNAGVRCLHAGQISVLDLGKFSPSVQIFVAEMILSSLWRCFRIWGQHAKVPLFVVCDEFQSMNKGTDSVLSQILREGRKYNFSLLLATQTLETFKPGETATIMQAATHLFFRPAPNEIHRVAHYTGADKLPEMKRRLRELHKGECIATGCFEIGNLNIERPITVRF